MGTNLGETGHGESEGHGYVEHAGRGAPVYAGGAAYDHQEGRTEDLAEEGHQEANPRHLIRPYDVLGT